MSVYKWWPSWKVVVEHTPLPEVVGGPAGCTPTVCIISLPYAVNVTCMYVKLIIGTHGCSSRIPIIDSNDEHGHVAVRVSICLVREPGEWQ